jgi:DNA polymerase (family 10)
VAAVLGEMADVLELTGGNPFKVRAYRQAAQVIDTLAVPVSELWRKGELEELPSVGSHIAQWIEELLAVEGVGPQTAGQAWKVLGIENLEALERAGKSGKLLELKRMGPRRVKAILEAIERHRQHRSRTPLHRAIAYADSIVTRLRALAGVTQATAAGSVRRRKETVGDVDLLVAAKDAKPVVRAFTQMPEVGAVLAQGPTKSSVRLRTGLQVDLRVLPPDSYGAALHYFTGNKAHNIAIRARAQKMGIKVSEYGVFDQKGKRLGGEREKDIFRAVGLPWIPPELREGLGEIEAAEAGRLPSLIEEEDLLGDLHVHSKASSDARSSLPELAEAARKLGRRYVAITDHSRSRPLGLDEAALAKHVAAIRQLNKELSGKPQLLAGIEVDILPDGTLDLPSGALSGLDCVVASVHSRFNDPENKMTDRVVRALRSGVVDILGHPSGRQIGKRDPTALNLERVLEVAREEQVALEVNAMPDRLDLTDQACRLAKEAGVPLVISSDSHNTRHLENLRYGVWVARRGWIEAKDVLNTLPLAALRRRFGARRARTLR